MKRRFKEEKMMLKRMLSLMRLIGCERMGRGGRLRWSVDTGLWWKSEEAEADELNKVLTLVNRKKRGFTFF